MMSCVYHSAVRLALSCGRQQQWHLTRPAIREEELYCHVLPCGHDCSELQLAAIVVIDETYNKGRGAILMSCVLQCGPDCSELRLAAIVVFDETYNRGRGACLLRDAVGSNNSLIGPIMTMTGITDVNKVVNTTASGSRTGAVIQLRQLFGNYFNIVADGQTGSLTARLTESHVHATESN